MERGKLIIFEGGEGSGKTTQINSFGEWLDERGVPYTTTREPGGTPIAEEVRNLLLDPENEEMESLTELFLYSAARAQIYLERIIPTLEAGEWVLADRSWPSTEAYQGSAGNVDMGIIKDLTRVATTGVTPDLLYIIDIDPVIGLRLEENPDRFADKGLEYHQKVRQGYLDIVEGCPEFAVKVDYRPGDIDGMQEEMREIARQRLGLGF